jgi:hypothetical protein
MGTHVANGNSAFMPDAALLDLFQRLAMALGIGFLVGIEREWKHRDVPEGERAAGLRTHAIIGLTGGVSAALLPWIGPLGFAALTLAFSIALVAFKLRESLNDGDISVTGTIAALLVFAIGAYAMLGDLRIVAAVGVTLAGLLAFKQALHDWVDKLTWKASENSRETQNAGRGGHRSRQSLRRHRLL